MKNMFGGGGGGIYLLSRALPDGLMSSFSGQAIGRFVMPATLREATTSLKSPPRGETETRKKPPKQAKLRFKKEKKTHKKRPYLDLTGVLNVVDEVKGLFDGLPESDHAVVPQHQDLERAHTRPRQGAAPPTFPDL